MAGDFVEYLPSWTSGESVEQFLAVFGRTQSAPEWRLIVAILKDAVDTLDRAQHPRADEVWHLRARADLEWIKQDDDRYVFSFVNICEFLELDHRWLRREILRRYNASRS
jgi:hypothetical protein